MILIKDYNKKQQYLQNGEIEKLQREVDELKQRIANLETIVTDKSYDLKDKINRL
jgi:flagellar motility protein MotE (MotC chaperone)